MLSGFQPSPVNRGRGQVFCAYAIETTPGLWSTAAGTGGPLLWNGSPAQGGVTAYLLAVSFSLSVASAVAGNIGLTGANAQTAAPSATTAIDSVGNCNIGGPTSACTAYRKGTVTNAGTFFMPLGGVDTGAITVGLTDDNLIHLGGAVAVPPGAWVSVAASAALTSAVMQIGLWWMEAPN